MIKFLEFLTRLMAKIDIVSFPLSVSLIIAAIIFKSNTNWIGSVTAIAFVITGILLGIFLTMRIDKKKRTP